MTIEATGPSANPWVVDMPEPLAATVFRYDKATRLTIIENWAALEEPERREYRDYLARTRLSWRRRERVLELVRHLFAGGNPRPTAEA